MKINRRIWQVLSGLVLVMLSSSSLVAQDQVGPSNVEPPEPNIKTGPNAQAKSEANSTEAKRDTKVHGQKAGQGMPTTSPTKRDPTRASKEMLELLQQPTNTRKTNNTIAKTKLGIVLKARMIVANRPAVAILEILGRFAMVKVGDEINLNAESNTSNDSGRLKVLNIDSNAVTLEFVSSKRKLVLR